MAKQFYPSFKADLQTALYDVLSGAYGFRVALMKGGSFNVAHTVFNDLVMGTNELSVAGYVRKDLAGRTRAASGNDSLFGATTVNWAALTAGQTVTAVILGKYAAGDPDTAIELIYWDDGGTSPNELPWATDGGGFDYDISAGLWKVTS